LWSKTLALTVRDWNAKEKIMLLRNNTTILVTRGENYTWASQLEMYLFWFPWFECRDTRLRAICLILLGSLRKHLYNHHRLQTSRFTKNNDVNMAVSDLLFSLVAIPDQITRIVTDSWHWHVSGILGSIFCKFYIFTSSLSLFVSVRSLVWIAIDRFVAVVFPLKLHRAKYSVYASGFITFTWRKLEYPQTEI